MSTFGRTLVLAVGLVGCARGYHMEVHAAPNPFTRPGCRAAFAPLHSERLLVGSMPEYAYVQEMSPKSAESYAIDKQESEQELQKQVADDHGTLFLAGGTPDNTFTFHVTFTRWAPGSGWGTTTYNGPGQGWGYTPNNAFADFLVDVVSPQGQLLDRFDLEVQATTSIFNASTGGRMRTAFKKAGGVVSRYISDNWLCAAH